MYIYLYVCYFLCVSVIFLSMQMILCKMIRLMDHRQNVDHILGFSFVGHSAESLLGSIFREMDFVAHL